MRHKFGKLFSEGAWAFMPLMKMANELAFRPGPRLPEIKVPALNRLRKNSLQPGFLTVLRQGTILIVRNFNDGFNP
jgi:hypothetical protein